jgi:hypothetical protein
MSNLSQFPIGMIFETTSIWSQQIRNTKYIISGYVPPELCECKSLDGEIHHFNYWYLTQSKYIKVL